MVKKIFMGIGVLVIALVVWLALQPGSYEFDRSIVVDGSQQEVYNKVADFKEWAVWSPWFVMDATNKVEYAGTQGKVGAEYSWEGELTGAGNMVINEIKGMEFIDMDINFTKPYTSTSGVTFKLTPEGNKTKVVWGMSGKMPFFMRWMTKSMEGFVGMDYERGLLMLKEYCETGEILTKVEYAGIVDYDEVNFVGIKHTISTDDMGKEMEGDFVKLKGLIEKSGEALAGPPISVYYDVDFTEKISTYATGMQFKNAATMEVPEGYIYDKIPSGKALKIIHTGRYEHSGNAWTGGYSYARAHKVKLSKKVKPFEVYLTDPEAEPDPAKWVTEIYLPIK